MNLPCLAFLAALATTCAAGCATPPPPPFSSSSSIIGVRITTLAPISILWNDSREAFFVKVDSGEATQQSTIIRSNYQDGDYVYLLNVEAGTYAVVAGRHFGQNRETFTTYLPEDVIRQSLVTVSEAEVAFLGEFEIQSSTNLGKMDSAQRHYIGLIQPGDRGGFSLFSTTYTYRGSLKDADQSPTALERFLRRAEDELAEDGWAEVLRTAEP